MRLVVLTTDTLHHAHFIRDLVRTRAVLRVIEETSALRAPFDTAHSFEDARDAYERELWFGGEVASVGSFAEVERHESVNDPKALASLEALQPDVVVVFGTGKLSPDVIARCPRGIVNLHGGDPEAYRGLDTQLWAVYHSDFGALVTTLHRLSAELDRGDIIATLPLPIDRDMHLHQLRATNTATCLQLVEIALGAFDARGGFVTRPQRAVGRYYSFMPTVLKDICVRRFEAYTHRLA